VIFAHGSGSSRFSSRNRAVAAALNDRGIGTLLFDLLTAQEEADRANVFDIGLLAQRLADAVHFVEREPLLSGLALGFFGASTGAAAALAAAVPLGDRIAASCRAAGVPILPAKR
jgi:putative phosphoribosyl transferase